MIRTLSLKLRKFAGKIFWCHFLCILLRLFGELVRLGTHGTYEILSQKTINFASMDTVAQVNSDIQTMFVNHDISYMYRILLICVKIIPEFHSWQNIIIKIWFQHINRHYIVDIHSLVLLDVLFSLPESSTMMPYVWHENWYSVCNLCHVN